MDRAEHVYFIQLAISLSDWEYYVWDWLLVVTAPYRTHRVKFLSCRCCCCWLILERRALATWPLVLGACAVASNARASWCTVTCRSRIRADWFWKAWPIPGPAMKLRPWEFISSVNHCKPNHPIQKHTTYNWPHASGTSSSRSSPSVPWSPLTRQKHLIATSSRFSHCIATCVLITTELLLDARCATQRGGPEWAGPF